MAATTQVRPLVWTFFRNTIRFGVAEFRCSWRPLYSLAQCETMRGLCHSSRHGAEVATNVMEYESKLRFDDPRKTIGFLSSVG